ncbi:MAG: hypothetical protein HY690_09535 [Chloroflexi bacterium]|nr:hypothetical protein [Chloroflexota bacterium]
MMMTQAGLAGEMNNLSEDVVQKVESGRQAPSRNFEREFVAFCDRWSETHPDPLRQVDITEDELHNLAEAARRLAKSKATPTKSEAKPR